MRLKKREKTIPFGIEGHHSASFFLDYDMLRAMKSKVYQIARTISAHNPKAGKKFDAEWEKERNRQRDRSMELAGERKAAIDKIMSECAKKGNKIGRTGYQRMIDVGIEVLKGLGFSSSEIQRGLTEDSGRESAPQVGGARRRGRKKRRRILTMAKKKKAKKKKTKKGAGGKSVKELMAELEKCKDPSKARKLRKQLRDAGHSGGLGKPKGENLSKARAAKGKKKKVKKTKKSKKSK